MKTIYDFKKGDAITRIQPAKPYSPERIDMFGVVSGGIRDRSYMGEKLIFVGIANGQIYFKQTDDFHIQVFGGKLLNLDLDIWDGGWDYYIEPATLLEGIDSVIDDSAIEEQIKKAIENEDYELAKKLQQKLNKK